MRKVKTLSSCLIVYSVLNILTVSMSITCNNLNDMTQYHTEQFLKFVTSSSVFSFPNFRRGITVASNHAWENIANRIYDCIF